MTALIYQDVANVCVDRVSLRGAFPSRVYLTKAVAPLTDASVPSAA